MHLPVVPSLTRILATAVLGLGLLLAGKAASAPAGAIRAAIEAERPSAPVRVRVTGITVPHHLLAADLIARGFWATGRQDWKRVVILSPDHFGASRTPLAVVAGDLPTLFGSVPADTRAIRRLLKDRAMFSTTAHLAREHGINAVTPFVKHFFPKARVVAMAVSPFAGPAELDRAMPALRRLLDQDTLVIQSTDYSHDLPLARAVLNDQQTMNVIAAGIPSAVFGLKPVEHLDAQGAQYLQMRLQAEAFAAAPVIIANRNSAEYGASRKVTTSYLVKAWGPDAASLGALRFADQAVTMFAGDTMTGRYFAPLLARSDVRKSVLREILAVTRNAPLVVNLEGVMPDLPVQGMPASRLAMEPVIALPLLKQANVQAASLANNHAFDLGQDGFEATRRTLEAGGIKPIPQSATAAVNGLHIVALNFVQGRGAPDAPLTQDADIEAICRNKATPPLVAMVHWGREYTRSAGPAEQAIARRLQRCGVQAVIGAHSHQASTRMEAVDGGRMLMVYSLGNFLFDQKFEGVSGALLEVRVFRQGTFAARLVPVRNFFAVAHAKNRHAVGRPD